MVASEPAGRAVWVLHDRDCRCDRTSVCRMAGCPHHEQCDYRLLRGPRCVSSNREAKPWVLDSITKEARGVVIEVCRFIARGLGR